MFCIEFSVLLGARAVDSIVVLIYFLLIIFYDWEFQSFVGEKTTTCNYGLKLFKILFLEKAGAVFCILSDLMLR